MQEALVIVPVDSDASLVAPAQLLTDLTKNFHKNSALL